MEVSKSHLILFLSLFLLYPFLNVYAGELPRVKPEEVGLSSERLARLDNVMKRYVDEEKLAGVLTLVARDVFFKYFKNGFPARMSSTTDFVNPECLCMLDGVAYKTRASDVS